MKNDETVKLIKKTIKKIRPYLIADGGDIDFIKYEDGLVYVNGDQAFQRGKKPVDGDVVTYEGQTIKIIK